MANYDGDEAANTYRGTRRADTINGNGGDDRLYGLGGDDVIDGGTGRNRLDGGAANDTIVSRGEGDTILGGAGDDSVTFEEFALVYGDVDGGDGDADTLNFHLASFGALSGESSFTGFEHIVAGSILRGDFEAGTDSVIDLSGLTAATLADDLVSIYGYDGDDRMIGGAERDGMYAGGGDDWLSGGGGIDYLYGFEGTNRLEGGDDLDFLYSGGVRDTLDGGDGDDTIVFLENALIGGAVDGGEGFDAISFDLASFDANSGSATFTGIERILDGSRIRGDFLGGADCVLDLRTLTAAGLSENTLSIFCYDGDDTVYGGAERDGIVGGAGDDNLYGGGAVDFLQGDDGNDRLEGGEGLDTAAYAAASSGVRVDLRIIAAQDTMGAGLDTIIEIENLVGSGFADTLSGDRADNIISGGGDRDVLYGRSGKDLLQGEDGADTLVGGTGADTLIGGAGADRFSFAAADSGAARARQDLVTDFSQTDGDRVVLRDFAGFEFVGTDPFSSTAGEIRYVIADGETKLVADIDGDGIGDFAIRFEGEIAFTSTDLVL